MIIAIDMDQTYTANPDMWDEIINVMKDYEATVYCVTCRPEWDTVGMSRVENIVDEIFYTNSEAKIPYMKQQGYHVDIWVDDTPATITGGGSTMYG